MRYSRAVQLWIWAGVMMVFFQIVIGGITRLTGSGLSITRWEIVTGTLPPMSEKQWDEAFELYRETPQYQQINEGMTMGEFKYIYFWEYVHRLWARLLFFVFLIPFIVFSIRGKLDRSLNLKLLGAVGLAAVVASVGWIMVASGLIDRPWVNAYKLSIHLILGLTLFAYMGWVGFKVTDLPRKSTSIPLKPWLIFFAIFVVQIFLGGMMSGTKAALFYPTWPDMHGELVPQVILQGENWNAENFTYYDRSLFMTALVQFSHRILAYALLIFGLILVWKHWRIVESQAAKNGLLIFSALLISQVIIGIVTLLTSWGEISVFWGVLHQAVASLLLISVLYILYIARPSNKVVD
jgi:heme a synthase